MLSIPNTLWQHRREAEAIWDGQGSVGLCQGCNRTFPGAVPSPQRTRGGYLEAQEPSSPFLAQHEPGQCGPGQLHTQVPLEGFQEEGRGSVNPIPTRLPSCTFPPFSSSMVKDLETSSYTIPFRGNWRKVTRIRTVVTHSMTEEVLRSLLCCWRYSISWSGWWLHKCIHISKCIKLFIKICVFYCM